MTKISAWVRAARPEYLPIVLLMFGAGSAAGALDARAFDGARALFACASLLLIQLAAVLTNEHFDYAADILTRHGARFAGGTRVIVSGALSHDEVLRGVVAAVALLGAASGLLLALSPHELRGTTLVVLALALALGLGHTAPPLRLSHRGLGEINAAFTLGVVPALAGWVVQGGSPADPLPWLVAMPPFCALLAARTLAGIPDARADASVRRRTYAVVFGVRGAAGVAIVAMVAACVAGVLLWQDGIVTGRYGAAYAVAPALALPAIAKAAELIRSGEEEPPLDGAIGAALLLALWLGALPFAYFVQLVRA